MGACCAKPQTESPAGFPERLHKGSTSMETQTTPGLSKSRPKEEEGRMPRGACLRTIPRRCLKGVRVRGA